MMLELLAPAPELAVKVGVLRQAGLEPGRRVEEQPVAGVEVGAVPVGAHAVQLLADPPSCRIDRRLDLLKGLGEQDSFLGHDACGVVVLVVFDF
jgi:hypothetical protein